MHLPIRCGAAAEKNAKEIRATKGKKYGIVRNVITRKIRFGLNGRRSSEGCRNGFRKSLSANRCTGYRETGCGK